MKTNVYMYFLRVALHPLHAKSCILTPRFEVKSYFIIWECWDLSISFLGCNDYFNYQLIQDFTAKPVK